MGDYFDWWVTGGDWYDLKQSEQLDAMSVSHARTTSRLTSKLREESRRSQGLEQRLVKLEEAVVAMVELEDLRGVMENFSDAVATRRYARDVLAQIPALGRVATTGDPEEPPDVPGYWLHPAVRAVAARLRDDEPAARAASDEARRRDPMRTAQFLAAVAILARSSVADDDLATLWPTTREVSAYQRQLWLAVARGGLGDEARESLTAALAWVLQQAGLGALAPEVETGERFVQVRQQIGGQTTGASLDDLVMTGLLARREPADPGAAAAYLEELRSQVETSLESGRTGPEPAEVPEGVADLLAQVVSAGAPAEEPLVARIIEIRSTLAAIGATTSIAAPALLDEQALDVVELVRADLGRDADPAARAVAIRALQEPIEQVAQRLAEKAAQPLPDAAEVRVVGGISVSLTSAGPTDHGWRDRVRARVLAGAPDPRGPLVRAIAGGAVALLGLVLGLVSAPGWLVLLAPGLGLLAHGWWTYRRARADTAERLSTALAKADAAVTRRSQELAGELISARERQSRVPVALDAVRAALAAVPSA